MKTQTIHKSLFLNWSDEDLRNHYEFLLDREDTLTSRQKEAFEIVSELLMEREALEMVNEMKEWEELGIMSVPDAMKLIVENLTPNGNQKLEDAQSVIINALNLTQIDQPFGFKE
jgi:hypothetical protein